MKTFRVAIVGAGYVSAHHLRALTSLDFVEVVAIVDVDQSRAQTVAGRFGIPRVLTNISELGPNEADVVHVLTPPDSHCSITLQALEAGCHVFVEKPMAERESDCERMIEAAMRLGKVLSVNHSARMDPIVLQAAQRVREGVCGEVVGVDFLRSSDYPAYRGGPLPPPYRTASYPFQDLGVHGISILETFLGTARAADVKFWHRGADLNLAFDEWRGTVECERGIGQMYISWNSRPIRSEIFIHGTRASMHVDCFLQTCEIVKTLPGPKFLSNVVGGIRNSMQALWRIPLNTLRFVSGRLPGAPGIHNSIASFYESLRAGKPVPIPAEEGRRVVALMATTVRQADAAGGESRRQVLRPRPPASVLVTGANGFLGRQLTRRLLSQGKRVRVFVRRALSEWEGNPLIDVVLGDLGDPQAVNCAVEGVDTVFHVGAAMRGAAADFERATVWGTRNVVNACVRHRVGRLVHVSSLSVLDHASHNPDIPVTENSAREPYPARRGPYTQTKLEAEEIVRSAIEKQCLSAVILRPGQIFGVGAEHMPPPGVMSFGRTWVVVGNGTRNLPLVYVEDMVDALLLAAECAESDVYNIVDTADPVSQYEYLRAVSIRIAASTSIHYMPEFMMLWAGWCCEWLEAITKRRMPLSRYRVRSIRPLFPFDIHAAVERLGWKPAVGTRTALETIVWQGRSPRTDKSFLSSRTLSSSVLSIPCGRDVVGHQGVKRALQKGPDLLTEYETRATQKT